MTADRVLFARIAGGAIRVEDCADAVRADDAGAVVTFEGVVRDHDDGRGVLWLDYSAHPAARQAIRQVALDVSTRYPEVRIAVEHRIGRLGIGDVALSCAVSSAHRADAFAACGLLVDEVKQRVPIWKQQGLRRRHERVGGLARLTCSGRALHILRPVDCVDGLRSRVLSSASRAQSILEFRPEPTSREAYLNAEPCLAPSVHWV